MRILLTSLCLSCLCLLGFTTNSYADKVKVLGFAGSTREGSVNKRLVTEATDLATQMGADVTLIDLKDYSMPLYHAELESSSGMPSQAKKLRQLMIQSDVIFIASPEYNASITGILKNALDWASRGENGGGSRDAFKGKKFAIMSASPGPTGGARGLKHLQDIIEALGGTVTSMQFSLPGAYQAFDEQGHLKDPQQLANFRLFVKNAIN